MNMLAQTADDVGIEKLSQLMQEIHTTASITIAVIPSEVEGFEAILWGNSTGMGPSRTGPISLGMMEVISSEDRNDIAHGDEFLHPRGVPVGGADAPVTGCAADRFGLVRPVNSDMRFA